MKKILAILMALAMLLGFAACGGSKPDKPDETTAAIVSDDDAIYDAAVDYYNALASGNGKKIKEIMPSFFEEYFANEDVFGDLNEEEAEWIEQLYGIDLSEPEAMFELYALSLFEEYGEIDSIDVEDVDISKFSKRQIQDEIESLEEIGVFDYEIEDGASGEVELVISLEDGEEIETTQSLTFVKESDGWKVLPDDEDSSETDPVDPDPVDPDPVDPVDPEEAAIKTAATAYYTAVVTTNGAGVRSSMSGIFEQFLQMENPLEGLTDEEIAVAEALYGVSLSGPDAFYTYFAIMTKEELGEPVNINVDGVTYEKFTAEEVNEFNGELSAEGISGILITDVAEAEVEVTMTFDDGTTSSDVAYITFIEENGSWKAFPDM